MERRQEKLGKISYVDVVLLVSDEKILVDPELVDVRDDRHVRNSIQRLRT